MKRSIVAAAMAVTLFGAAAAPAKAPKKPVAGTYKGKTTQKQKISIAVKTKGKCGSFKAPCISKLAYKANFRCYDQDDVYTGSANAQPTTLPAMKIKKNKVGVRFSTSDGSDVVDLKIAFNGKKASGSVHEIYSSKGGDTCYSEPPANGVVKFTAKR